MKPHYELVIFFFGSSASARVVRDLEFSAQVGRRQASERFVWKGHETLVRQQIASMTTFLNEKTENKQQQTFIAKNFIQIITTLLLTGKRVKSSLRGRPSQAIRDHALTFTKAILGSKLYPNGTAFTHFTQKRFNFTALDQ